MAEEKEAKPEEQAQEPPFQIGFKPDNQNVMLLKFDLSRLGKPLARGFIVEADDLICQWYANREIERQRLRSPGFLDSIKRGGREFLSKFH